MGNNIFTTGMEILAIIFVALVIIGLGIYFLAGYFMQIFSDYFFVFVLIGVAFLLVLLPFLNEKLLDYAK